MKAAEGIRRLVQHTQPGPGSFLEMLRPYRGLREEILDDVMDALRACGARLADERVPHELLSAVWAISYLTRTWALAPDGALRRNHRISDGAHARLAEFVDRFDYAVMMLIEGASEEEAFAEDAARRP